MTQDKINLPSELDEAAEEFYPDFSDNITSKAAVDSMRDAFKAGAEWMAKQGVIVNGVISRDGLIYDLYTPELDNVLDTSWEDKNVIVQIRKK
jgi:hypothetical protein